MTLVNKFAVPVLCMSAVLVGANAAHAQASANAGSAAPQPVGANEVFARWDKDHNKSLSQEEFKVGWDQVQANLLVFKLRETFATMDSNRDGVLGPAEYANLELVRKAGGSAPPMSTFDANKSQGLDFREYVGFVKAMMKPKP